MKRLLAVLLFTLFAFPQASSAALTDNLVSYWKLDESSGNAVDAHGSNTLTNNNTATYAAGKINNAVSLARASSQSLSIADASQTGLDITGDLTISAWVNFTTNPSVGQYYIIAAKGGINAISDTETQYVLWKDNDGNKYGFGVRGAGSFKFASYVTTPSTGTWYHLVGVYTAGSKVEIFLNGSSVGSNTTSIPASLVDTARPFDIGADESGAATFFFNGQIDEVGIWSRALSNAEITELYNSGAGKEYPFTTSSSFGFYSFFWW